MLQTFLDIYRICRAARVPLLPTLLVYYWRTRHDMRLLAYPGTRVSGLQRLQTNGGMLNVGVSYVGFTVPQDVAQLQLGGRLITHGTVSIGKGCRVDIGTGASIEIGANTYINPGTMLIIMHGLRIGAGCAISWQCQFLDDDYHQLTYAGKRPMADPCITVGDRVWIGSRVSVLKGAMIPNGCVVASGAVVTRAFTEENCLLAGSPAKVVRRDVQWK